MFFSKPQKKWKLTLLQKNFSSKKSSWHLECDLTNLRKIVRQNSIHLVQNAEKAPEEKSFYLKRHVCSKNFSPVHENIGFENPVQKLFVGSAKSVVQILTRKTTKIVSERQFVFSKESSGLMECNFDHRDENLVQKVQK